MHEQFPMSRNDASKIIVNGLIVGTTALVVPNIKLYYEIYCKICVELICWLLATEKNLGKKYLCYSDYVHDAALNIVSSLLDKNSRSLMP